VKPYGDYIIIEGILSLLQWDYGTTASPHGEMSSPTHPPEPPTPWSRSYD